MTLEDAFDAEVSVSEAIEECRKHGIVADYDAGELFDCATGETIAMANLDGMYSGGEVLAWLGY